MYCSDDWQGKQNSDCWTCKATLIAAVNTYCCGIDSTPFSFEVVGMLCNLARILALHLGLQTGQFPDNALETIFSLELFGPSGEKKKKKKKVAH